MKTSFKIIAATGTILLTAALLTSCSNNRSANHENKDAKEIADERNEAKFNNRSEVNDAEYISEAYSNGLYEIEAAKHAKQYAVAQQTRDLAGELITAHVKLNDQLKALAQSKQVSLQQTLTADQLDDIKELSEKKGVEYDKEYLDEVIEEHKEYISDFEKAADKSNDADVRKLFSESISHLRAHLDKAMSVKTQIK
jgi:putative membrane protein